MDNTMFAFSLTVLAGLATGLGGLLVLFSKKASKKFLSVCLSFSAGVMLYVSFAEILPEAFESLEYTYEPGFLIATAAFFAGIVLMALVDKFIPHDENTELPDLKSGKKSREKLSLMDEKELGRTGIMSGIAVAIHNLPEGLVTFMAAMYDPALGIAIAIAIIIHNIPEGIAVAAPIYYSTGSKGKAFLASLGAGLKEPLGAIIAWLLLQNIFGNMGGLFGITFAAAAGVMVYVSIHQLLPAAQKYGEHHVVMRWLFAGMAVMAASLVALEYLL